MRTLILALILSTLPIRAAFSAVSDSAAADAYYSAFKSSLGWTPNGTDDAKFKAAYEAAFGALLDYLKAHMDVLPAAHTGLPLQNASGQAVQVTPATGTGATIAPGTITGMGSVQ